MSHKKRINQATVDFVVGGCPQYFIAASKANIIVVVDAGRELTRVADLPHIIKLPLGDQDTVLTLLERVSQHQPEAQAVLDEYRKAPNVHVAHGMAQDWRLGRLAISDLWRRGELDAIFAQILNRAMEVTGGYLETIEVREINGNAGGTGSGGAPEIGEFFIQYAVLRTGAMILHRMIRFGGLSFVTVAPRAGFNTYNATEDNLNDALAYAEARRIYDLELIELPLRNEAGLPLRDNREMRALLAGALLQARFAPEVARTVDAIENNLKTTHALGAVRLVQADWSEFMDRELLIRAAATDFRHQLKALREQPEAPDLTVAEEAYVELGDPDSTLPAVDEAMKALGQGRLAATSMIDRLLDAPLARHKTVVWLRTLQSRLLALDQVLNPTSDRPGSLTEVREHCRRSRGVIARLEQTLAAARQAQEETDGRIEKLRRALREEKKMIVSWTGFATEIFKSAKRVRQERRLLVESFCETHRQAGEWSAKTEALQSALEQVRNELAQYEQLWIKRIEQGLDDAIGNRPATSDAALFASLEAIYPSLLDAILRDPTGAEGLLQALLLGAVSQITLQGLGEMLGSDADPQAIIAALEQENFAWSAPLWGGGIRYEPPRHRFIILPPLAAGDLAALKRAAEERGFTATLATTELTAAGCCIVQLSFFPVARREDVLTPFYAGARLNQNLNGREAFQAEATRAAA
ncbi:MAG: hypothetical protein ACREEM_01705 [Blastocatellia bacterium]